jgi:hypothetical protein
VIQEKPSRPGRDGTPDNTRVRFLKSETKFSMGSMMIIFLIAHLFKKDQTYSNLFSSALKEGIKDTFGDGTIKDGNGSVRENINRHDK